MVAEITTGHPYYPGGLPEIIFYFIVTYKILHPSNQNRQYRYYEWIWDVVDGIDRE